MIVFADRKIAIMTPPKCATSSLHTVFCTPPFDGMVYVGPSPTGPGIWDRHIAHWPNETASYRRLVVTRDPLDRLVSLYLFWARSMAGRGNATPSFERFVDLVLEEKIAPLYRLNLSRWIGECHYHATLRLESLNADLEREGLLVSALPKLDRSYRGISSLEFYQDDLLERVKEWAMPDCDQFSYEWPV